MEPTPPAEVPAVENAKPALVEVDPSPKFDATVHYMDGSVDSFPGIDSEDVDHSEQIVILKTGDPQVPGSRMVIIPVHSVRYIDVIHVAASSS